MIVNRLFLINQKGIGFWLVLDSCSIQSKLTSFRCWIDWVMDCDFGWVESNFIVDCGDDTSGPFLVVSTLGPALSGFLTTCSSDCWIARVLDCDCGWVEFWFIVDCGDDTSGPFLPVTTLGTELSSFPTTCGSDCCRFAQWFIPWFIEGSARTSLWRWSKTLWRGLTMDSLSGLNCFMVGIEEVCELTTEICDIPYKGWDGFDVKLWLGLFLSVLSNCKRRKQVLY